MITTSAILELHVDGTADKARLTATLFQPFLANTPKKMVKSDVIQGPN
jgi:hypothetical protein